MQKVRGITELRDYGKVQINLKKLMEKHDINVYRMSKLTGLKYNTIKSYYNNAPLTKVDLDVVAKMCYVLNCSVDDILEYVNPQN
mgnify:CR=1 FL=1